ncbi:MAG: CHAD domain-containing protein [Gammaproteobacteria bacterium PRO8]|nr:CHAD domain-containing protein [Gammaproteobacteria bacterium PRO8]
MAYLIRRRKSLDAEIRRILAAQLRHATRLLDHWADDPRASVHGARLTFKRIRAVLRLIRPGAAYIYRVEDAVFGGLGHDLARARDLESALQAARLLESRLPTQSCRNALRRLQRSLERRVAREYSHDLPRVMARARETLAAAARRVPDMPLQQLRRKDVRQGVASTLGRCTTAGAQAALSWNAGDLHRWRIQVKYLYHQSQLMQQMLPGWAQEAGPVLKGIGQQLGQHHDLVLLDLLGSQPDGLGRDSHWASIRGVALEARDALAAAALAAGTSRCTLGPAPPA